MVVGISPDRPNIFLEVFSCMLLKPFIETVVSEMKRKRLNYPKTIIVRRHSIKSSNNCAFCDKSTKFGTCIEKCIINRSGYWVIINFTPGALSNHSKCSKFLFSLNILSLCFHVLDLCFLVLILCYHVVLYLLLKMAS